MHGVGELRRIAEAAREATIANARRNGVAERIDASCDPLMIIDGTFDLVVADLSFISLCTVADAFASVAEDGADLVLLVKPQFEVGKGQVGRGGIVKDPVLWVQALRTVIDCLGRAGLPVQAVCDSPITGAKGNREFFVWARKGDDIGPEPVLPVDLEVD